MVKIGVHLRKLSQNQKNEYHFFWTTRYRCDCAMTDVAELKDATQR